MEALHDLSSLMKSHPHYRAPASVTSHIRELIASGDYHILSRVDQPHVEHTDRITSPPFRRPRGGTPRRRRRGRPSANPLVLGTGQDRSGQKGLLKKEALSTTW